MQLRARTKAGVNFALRAKRLQRFLVQFAARALEIGAAAARAGPLVPVEAEPAQVIHQLLRIGRLAAVGV